LVLTVTLLGQVIVGGWLSLTVTVCWQVAVFPDPSVTVHVTTVTPAGNCDGALLVTDATEQLSDVVGVPRLTLVAKHCPEFVLTVTFAGQVIDGG
jgi:hypothetical protein